MNTNAPKVIVIGGGVAGMSSALRLAEGEATVNIIEKNDKLGGYAEKWACMATTVCQNCGACLFAEMEQKVSKADNIIVHTETTLQSVDNSDKGITATLSGKSTDTLTADAILYAGGIKPFDPSSIPDLSYDNDKVITTAELNTILKEEKLADYISKENGKVAFIQCVGSRNKEKGLDYCSQVCCKTALRHAGKIKYLYPESDVSIFHIDLQVIGKQIRSLVDDVSSKVNFLQGTPGQILTDREPAPLTIIRDNPETGGRMPMGFDLVVLAVGMRPSDDLAKTAEILKLETNSWGFIDANKEFPKNVYVAGTACGPTDILASKQQAIAVAGNILESIQKDNRQNNTIAILGNGIEAEKAEKFLSAADYKTFATCQNDASKELVSIEGSIGDFTITTRTDSGIVENKAMAIVVAEGIDNQEQELPENVISYSDFKNKEDALPLNVAFWLDYSAPEWKDTTKQVLLDATKLAESDKKVVVLMDKMLVHGTEGQKLYDTAREKGVKFVRADNERKEIKQTDSGIEISVKDSTLPDIELSVNCDLLVIPEQVIPSKNNSYIAYRLNTELDNEGFLQTPNTRHRLSGSPRKGIYFAGACHDEVDDNDLSLELQAIVSSLDAALADVATENTSVAEIDEGKCARCLTCIRVCAHSAIALRGGGQPYVVPSACVGCGTCVAVCPGNAIKHLEYTNEKLQEETAETVIFACERSASISLANTDYESSSAKVITVPCAGRIGAEQFMQPLLGNAKRVVIAGCHEGNCRSERGGRIAEKRIEKAISESVITEDQVQYFNVAANEKATALFETVAQKEASND